MAITSISSFDASSIESKLNSQQVTKKDLHEIKEYLNQLTDEIRYELQHVSEVELQQPTKLSELENDVGYATNTELSSLANRLKALEEKINSLTEEA